MAHETYLTFEEFKARGGETQIATFPVIELKCRKRIDYLTASRVQNMKSVPEAVKQCMVQIIDIEALAGTRNQIDRADKARVSSFNTDGYSESYSYDKTLSAREVLNLIDDQIKTSLYGEMDDEGVPLLYRGVIA